MRVFTATLATETNTFAPLPTGLDAFHDRGYFPAGSHPQHLTLFAGPLWAARQRAADLGWTVVEGMVAFAQPGGVTTRHAWETLRDELLADLRAALPVQIVLLGLHGAMVAEGCDDCEGELLREVRAIVGPGVVVGAELDPHHHLSPAMRQHADLLVSFKEYPHTDVLERAHELLDLCAATAAGRIRPTLGVADCAMISIVHTTREPARSFVDRLQALEGRDGVLSISVTHGFPWGDVADMGTRVFVYTDDNVAQAQALARQLADELNGLRDALQPAQPGIDEALDQALSALDATDGGAAGPVVVADGADNPGGGAAGDSTFMLRRLIERGVAGAALGPLWDPQAVRIAFEAGLGATLPLRLGGKTSPLSGDPLDARCTVLALQRDMVMTGLAGTPVELGDCARVLADGVQVVLITRRNQAMGTDLFTQLGVDLAALRVVVVKSSQHFHASFAPIARRVIYAAAPGSVTADLNSLPYRKVRRPLWPLR
jgi:microcystin degradation protein MlrC